MRKLDKLKNIQKANTLAEQRYLDSKLNNILNEGASDILYHFTNTGNLLNILNTDEFSLTSVLGSKSDQVINKNKFFYLSTTRSKNSGYTRGDTKITLNGRKLKYNNKIIPVDYWQWSKNRADWSDDNRYIEALKSLEQEDRIITDKPIIPNAISYILEIHIHVQDIDKTLNNIIELCTSKNIKLYLYDNKKNWLNQINPIDNNIDFSNVTDTDNGYVTEIGFNYPIASLIAYNDADNYNILTKYLDDPKKIKKLDDTIKTRTENNFNPNSPYVEDGITYINSAISNIRSNSDKDSKFIISLLVKEFKKYGVNTVKDYLTKKQFKNKKDLNYYKEELRKYLINQILNEYPDGLDRYFDRFIEIDGEYSDKAYESEKFMKVVFKYINKINDYMKTQIFSDDKNIFKYYYTLDSDEIKKHINFDNIKLSREINVTDSFHDTETLDELFNYFVDYYLLQPIRQNYYDKIQSLYSEYEQQFITHNI
jgi:hypothetical protein